jgi:predicted regulator of Ras-like GTPase activity (Roadblock/LC7/MglB family)
MSRIQDSSEMQETSKLIAELLKPLLVPAAPAAMVAPAAVAQPVKEAIPVEEKTLQPEAPPAQAIPSYKVDALAVELPTDSDSPVQTAEDRAPQYRGDKLERALAAMCKRSGFNGAVVADNKGLPLAVYNSPVGADAIAAYTTVLGGALEKAGTLLGQHGAETISMDINYADKVVLRLFTIANNPYFIMVLCPQNVDARSEVELSVAQITAILTES